MDSWDFPHTSSPSFDHAYGTGLSYESKPWRHKPWHFQQHFNKPQATKSLIVSDYKSYPQQKSHVNKGKNDNHHFSAPYTLLEEKKTHPNLIHDTMTCCLTSFSSRNGNRPRVSLSGDMILQSGKPVISNYWAFTFVIGQVDPILRSCS